MATELPEENTDSTDVSRREVLQSGSQDGDSGCRSCRSPTQRRTFLGGVVASALGAFGLSGSASAKPDSNVVAERLEDHRVAIEVLVKHGLLNDRVLTAIENSSTRALVKSSAITMKRDEGTGLVAVTFAGGPEGVRFKFGDEFTDTYISLPDDVDGDALTQEMNDATDSVTTEAFTCCDDNGYCNLCEDVAPGRCTYFQFGAGTCGSYSCGVTVCEDSNGNGYYGWSCDCCGGGHQWCGGVPVCYDGLHC